MYAHAHLKRRWAVETYKTEEDAKAAAEGKNLGWKTEDLMFCPLMSQRCYGDGCVCWSPSIPCSKGPYSKEWWVSDPQCGNMMFFRECNIPY
jgi:hypothetical protein